MFPPHAVTPHPIRTHIMIELIHTPVGIEHPYEQLPEERFPRHPLAGQTFEIGLVTRPPQAVATCRDLCTPWRFAAATTCSALEPRLAARAGARRWRRVSGAADPVRARCVDGNAHRAASRPDAALLGRMRRRPHASLFTAGRGMGSTAVVAPRISKAGCRFRRPLPDLTRGLGRPSYKGWNG